MISIIISNDNEVLAVQRGGQVFLATWSDQDTAQYVISHCDERWSLMAVRGVHPVVLTKVIAALTPVCGYVLDPSLRTEQIKVLALDD